MFLFPVLCSVISLLCVITFFPSTIRDFDSLNEEDHSANLQLALDVSEREFGIRPFTSEKEMSGDQEPDKTTMITYLSKFYELFRGTPLPASGILHRPSLLPPPSPISAILFQCCSCGRYDSPHFRMWSTVAVPVSPRLG